MIAELTTLHLNTLNGMSLDQKRYLYQEIQWDLHALCILGGRGVGKTTLLMQYYLERFESPEKCLYLSADNIIVIGYGLFKIAQEFFAYGGETLLIDEVHKYPNWSQEVKNIIDTYPSKQIIISGSSALELRKSKYDLSRRIVYYELRGFSFREYLAFNSKISAPKLSIENILEKHTKIATALSQSCQILHQFKNYLSQGYYPFCLTDKQTYLHRVNNIVEKVIFEDIVVNFNMTQAKTVAIKKLLWLIASSYPFIPNIEKLSRELSISKEYVYLYLDYLELSGLTISLRTPKSGFRAIRKPGKVFFRKPLVITGHYWPQLANL